MPQDTHDKDIILLFDNILSITIYGEKQPKIEILTCCQSYSGVFDSFIDFEEALRLLKQNFGEKLVCEFRL